jgi:hypothetical protein
VLLRRDPFLTAIAGLVLLGCRGAGGHPEHPDDPINAPPPSSVETTAVEEAPKPAPKPAPAGPGVAYAQARKLELVRDAVPCPADCARGHARTRCDVAADIRFHDLVAKGSHREVRAVLERSPGVESCFASVADAGASRLPSFRIPLDFVIGPAGELQSREAPDHEPDPQLEQMLECVGRWLDGLSFSGAGRPLPTRVRLHVEPVGTCRAPE